VVADFFEKLLLVFGAGNGFCHDWAFVLQFVSLLMRFSSYDEAATILFQEGGPWQDEKHDNDKSQGKIHWFGRPKTTRWSKKPRLKPSVKMGRLWT
jgi:hypothetical protein